MERRFIVSAEGLGDQFLDHWRGDRASLDVVAAREAVHSAWIAARSAWPGVELDREVYARWLAEKAPPDRGVVEGLRRLHASDLYLARACVSLMDPALAAFDARYCARVGNYLARLDPSPTLVDDTRQLLRERLFLGTRESPGKISAYGGLGPLEGWVRIVALRTALNLGAGRAPFSADEELDAVASGSSPAGSNAELDYIKARYRGAVTAAFREALASLDRRQRTLLRLSYVEGQTPGSIARVYGVHRTTALRWVDAAEHELLVRMRASLTRAFGITGAEAESLATLVRSRIEISLAPLLEDDER